MKKRSVNFDESNLFNELTRDVPDGMWVAISQDEKRLVAQGYTADEARAKAEEAGEKQSSLYRVRHFIRRRISVVR